MTQNWKKSFITIYIGQAFSILGSAAVQFAIIWWLTEQTKSPITLTTAAIVGFLPNIIVGPFAGYWVDKYNRKTVMIAADGLVALSSVILGIAFLINDNPSVLFIYAILFIRGLGGTFHNPAMQAAIPTLVPTEMLTKAGGWGNMISSMSNMLGPVIGAALMGFMPIESIMLIDIAGAAFAIICLLFIKIPDIPRSEEKIHFLTDLKLGFKAIGKNKPLLSVGIPMVLVNIIYMPLGSLFPLLILTHFNGTAFHNSFCEFTFAGGLLISSLIMGVWGGMKRRFLMVSLSVLLLGAAAFVGGILPTTGYFAFIACAFIMGCAGTFINVPLMAYIQESTAPELMGKVFSLILTAMSLAMPIGLLIAGPVSEVTGVDNWFIYSGIAMLFVGILCWLLTKRYDKEKLKIIEE